MAAQTVVNLNAATGSEMSFSTNPEERTELQEMKKRAEEAKLKIVTKIVEKRNKEKHEAGFAFVEDYLINAFKQCVLYFDLKSPFS